MKLSKIPVWIIVSMLVPLVYLFLLNPLFIGYSFSSILSPGKKAGEQEVRQFLQDRYNEPFEIISFNRANLHGTFEGRVLSVDDGVVFNVFLGQSGSPKNDYLFKKWAKPQIESVVKNSDVVYEVEYDAAYKLQDIHEPDYWDTNFIKEPQKLSLRISLMYINKMTREQIFDIMKTFKSFKIGKVSLNLYPAKLPPDMKLLNKLGFEQYYLYHKDSFDDPCEILNHEVLGDINLFQLGSSCLKMEAHTAQ